MSEHWTQYDDNHKKYTQKGKLRTSATSLGRAIAKPSVGPKERVNHMGNVIKAKDADCYTVTASFGVIDKTSGRMDGVIAITCKHGRVELTWPRHALFALPGLYPKAKAKQWVEDAAVILNSYDQRIEQGKRSEAMFVACANDIYATILEERKNESGQ